MTDSGQLSINWHHSEGLQGNSLISCSCSTICAENLAPQFHSKCCRDTKETYVAASIDSLCKSLNLNEIKVKNLSSGMMIHPVLKSQFPLSNIDKKKSSHSCYTMKTSTTWGLRKDSPWGRHLAQWCWTGNLSSCSWSWRANFMNTWTLKVSNRQSLL